MQRNCLLCLWDTKSVPGHVPPKLLPCPNAVVMPCDAGSNGTLNTKQHVGVGSASVCSSVGLTGSCQPEGRALSNLLFLWKNDIILASLASEDRKTQGILPLCTHIYIHYSILPTPGRGVFAHRALLQHTLAGFPISSDSAWPTQRQHQIPQVGSSLQYCTS